MGLEGIIAIVALVVGGIALARSSGRQGKEDATKATSEVGPSARAVETAPPSINPELSSKVRHLESELATLEQQVAEHSSLLLALVTDDEARHLWFLERGDAVNYESHPGLQQELRSLTRRGFIEKRGDFRIHELHSPFNLVESFQLTSLGKTLLRKRQHLRQRDVAPADSLPPGALPAEESSARASTVTSKVSA